MSKDTGGPAFPYEERTGDGQPYRDHFGMSLRDYFAAKAMQGIATRGVQNANGDILEYIALDAYRLADAMLEAREA